MIMTLFYCLSEQCIILNVIKYLQRDYGLEIIFLPLLIFESKKKFSGVFFKHLKQPRKLSVALDQTMVYFLALN